MLQSKLAVRLLHLCERPRVCCIAAQTGKGWTERETGMRQDYLAQVSAGVPETHSARRQSCLFLVVYRPQGSAGGRTIPSSFCLLYFILCHSAQKTRAGPEPWTRSLRVQRNSLSGQVATKQACSTFNVWYRERREGGKERRAPMLLPVRLETLTLTSTVVAVELIPRVA